MRSDNGAVASRTDDASRFRQVVEMAPNALLMVDGGGRVVLANAQAERMFGYSRDELINQPVEALVPDRFRAAHPKLRDGFFSVPSARPMGAGRDLFGRRKDGQEFPVEIGLNPVQTDEGVMVLGSIVDISDRKRAERVLRDSEERFRKVVDAAPNAIIMVNRSGEIVLANAQAALIFGYAREELVGKAIESLVPQAVRTRHPAFRNSFFATPNTRAMGAGRDLYALRKDGTEFPVEIGLNPIETPDGPMVLSSVVDITERKSAEQAVEAALQEKTVLLQEVHHRVKNNLQIISSLLNLQAAHTADAGAAAALAESQARVKAIGLIHQLLYERSDFSGIDLGEYLKRLGGLLAAAFGSDLGRVRLTVSGSTVPVRVDLNRAVPCGLIVSELVSNAYRHGFPGEREGQVLVSIEREAGGDAVLVVEDDGVGLPPGFSLEDSKGLGFQLLPMLADQMKARLEIRHEGGARFQLSFDPEGEAA